MKKPDTDDLSAKLRAWKVDPQVPDSFQRAVWQRVATRQAARESAFWPRMTQWFSTEFIRPQFASATVILSLMASLGVAHLQAQETKARQWQALEARYAASVDPLAMSR
jgi:hypothetical protein